MSKKRAFSLLLLLAVAVLLMAGCAPEVNSEGVYTAPTWIAWLAGPLNALIQFVYNSILTPIGLASYGLAIILVTIFIRVLLYPLTRKQMQSMKKMQAVQPKMKELQEKYGKDREKLAQKQMELYKEEGVNPAGGCLPLLIQMPILFAFYYALLMLGPKLNEPFLWIPSLALPSYGAGMSWLQPITPQHLLSPEVLPYLILPILYILSQVVMQRQSQTSNPTPGAGGSTNTIMMLMPLMFGYITLIVPSGLTLYWFTSNVLQIIQQGFTTGWSGILPSKKQPAPATTGSKNAVVATKSTSTTASASPSPSSSAASAVPGGTDEFEDMSAGRRRKMRKKKR
jgi:YidC/Oxa1 family membrane protein insertase